MVLVICAEALGGWVGKSAAITALKRLCNSEGSARAFCLKNYAIMKTIDISQESDRRFSAVLEKLHSLLLQNWTGALALSLGFRALFLGFSRIRNCAKARRFWGNRSQSQR